MAINKVDEGKFEVSFYWDHPLTGQRKRFRRYSPHTSKRRSERWEAEQLAQLTDRNYWLAKKEREAVADIPKLYAFKNRFVELLEADPETTAGTVTNYESKLRNHVVDFVPDSSDTRLGDLRLDQITNAHCEDLINHLCASYKPNTVRGAAIALSSLFTKAIDRGVIAENQRPKINPPSGSGSNGTSELPKFLTDAEVDALLEAADDRIKTMIDLCLRTGLRIGEIRGLIWDDINFKTRELRVCRQYPLGCSTDASEMPLPKGKTTRTIPLTTATLELLENHRGSMWAGDLFVFSFRRLPEIDPSAPTEEEGTSLEPIHTNRHRSTTQHSFARAGIPEEKCGWHCLRHTYAARLASRGVSLRLIQDVLGHSKIATTEIYADLMPRATDAVRDELETMGF